MVGHELIIPPIAELSTVSYLGAMHPTKTRLATTIITMIAALTLTGCANTNTPQSGASQIKAQQAVAPTLTIHGILTLTTGQFMWNDTALCWGDGGYDDIAIGSPITITDETGTVIGIGHIDTSQASEFAPDFTMPGRCTFGIMAKNIPANHDFYGVEVAHRGAVKYTKTDLANSITMTIN